MHDIFYPYGVVKNCAVKLSLPHFKMTMGGTRPKTAVIQHTLCFHKLIVEISLLKTGTARWCLDNLTTVSISKHRLRSKKNVQVR